MKNISLTTIAIGIVTAMLMAGCDGGAFPQNETTLTPSLAAKIISRADLVQAVWNQTATAAKDAAATAATASPDAECIATSGLIFNPTNAFNIMKRPADDITSDGSPVIIVGTINVVLPDRATDKRGASCADGELRYTIGASDVMPIDLELSDEAQVGHSILAIATDKPAPYPKSCAILAHFEKNGADCVDALPPAAPKAQDVGDQVVSDETADGGSGEIKADVNSEDKEAATMCAVPTIPDIKLVVDKYDCSGNAFGKR